MVIKTKAATKGARVVKIKAVTKVAIKVAIKEAIKAVTKETTIREASNKKVKARNLFKKSIHNIKG